MNMTISVCATCRGNIVMSWAEDEKYGTTIATEHAETCHMFGHPEMTGMWKRVYHGPEILVPMEEERLGETQVLHREGIL